MTPHIAAQIAVALFVLALAALAVEAEVEMWGR